MKRLHPGTVWGWCGGPGCGDETMELLGSPACGEGVWPQGHSGGSAAVSCVKGAVKGATVMCLLGSDFAFC